MPVKARSATVGLSFTLQIFPFSILASSRLHPEDGAEFFAEED